MLNKIPKIKAPTPNRNRNAFDLSQRHLFTAHAGMLLPVLSLDLLPHDHVEINATDFMRTLPMNTAAFASMRGVYEFFFVPYHQLWSHFDQFITGMTDYHASTSFDVHKGITPSRLPYFDLKGFYDRLKSLENTSDLLSFPYSPGALRLLDLLGYSRFLDSSGTPYPNRFTDVSNFLQYNCNPLRILAYNKIYSDYYRNNTYEKYNVKSFNCDHLQGGPMDLDYVQSLFELKYRNTQTDYFTNVRPSQLFKFPSSSPDVISLNIPDRYESIVNSDNSVSIFTEPIIDQGSGDSSDLTSVNSIRAAFAVDKLLSTTMRAGKTFYEQMKAHYGVSIPDSRDGMVDYLGGFDSDFQISDVTQQSGTTVSGNDSKFGGYLGRVVGKATGSGSGKIRFDAKEHGVLMCIYSIVPQIQYDCTRLDPMVTKLNRFDYFTPEFENLGMQPLPAQYISTFTSKGNKVIGWQPRYSEYKTALDINHGQFVDKDALSYWSVGRFRSWSRFPDFYEEELKIHPNMLDSIFAVNYNGTELTDCAFGGCNFNIVKVSDMSVDGMPRV